MAHSFSGTDSNLVAKGQVLTLRHRAIDELDKQERVGDGRGYNFRTIDKRLGTSVLVRLFLVALLSSETNHDRILRSLVQ